MCIICSNDFEQDSEVRILNCKHIFHTECIDKWLSEYSNKCPICKWVYTLLKKTYFNFFPILNLCPTSQKPLKNLCLTGGHPHTP